MCLFLDHKLFEGFAFFRSGVRKSGLGLKKLSDFNFVTTEAHIHKAPTPK
jgi:hypothetical protein